MTAPVQNITFQEGQNWLISFAAHQEDGTTPLALPSGSDLEFRVSSPIDDVATNILTLNTADGVTITDDELGLADILITTAAQTSAGIKSGGIYFYEIRVIIDNVPQTQIEGQLSVESSLFATVVDPLVEEFHARFPEFTEDDTTISLFIADAKRVIDGDTSWRTEDKALATQYLAAHIMMMRKTAAQQYAAGGVQAGAIKTVSVEDRTLTFDTRATATASRTGLAQTAYGQEYLRMLRRNTVYIMRA